MNRIKYAIVLTVLLLSAAVVSAAQTGFRATPQTVRKVKDYVGKLDKAGFNGTLLIALNGKPVVSKGFGYTDFERKLKNTPQTIFDIGSLTKQFTAAAILKLEMQGKLSTADKITKYFQNVPDDKAGITIHDLLRHSAGLPAVVGGDFEKISEADFVAKVLNAPLKFLAGTRFGYSNVGYSLLALIIEKVSGQTYERFLYENLWQPAGMETTGYTRPRFDKNLIAVGYRSEERWGKPTEREWDADAPFLHLKGNGGILSTALDLYKWDRALATEKILSKAAKEKYFHPALRADEAGMSYYYAYGWDVSKTARGTTRARHNGTNRVFFADFYRFIDEGVTIILLTNKSLNNANDTAYVISRTIFEPDYKPSVPVPDNAANRAFTDEIIKIALDKNLSAALESYRQRRKTVDLLEDVVNEKGFELMEAKKMNQAFDIFRLNLYAFPTSSIAYESLGEAYLEAGDKKSALENFRKSLSHNPENQYARNMIKKLEE